MKAIFTPLVRIIGKAIAQEAARASRRSLPQIIFTSLAIIFSVVAIGGGTVTAYMYLSEHITDRHAMAIVTGVVIMLAVTSGLIARCSRGVEDTQPEEEQAAPQENKGSKDEIIVMLGAQAGNLISRNPKNAAIIALAVGVAFGVSSELRQAVLDQFLPEE